MATQDKPDRLSGFLQHFQIRAGVFHSGTMCGSADFADEGGAGHLHIFHSGRLRVTGPGSATLEITEPTVLFYPRGLPHRLEAETLEGEVELLCAGVDLGGGANPLALALPPVIVVPFSESDGLRATLDVLIDEAFTTNCGRQAVIDRLCEVVVVKLLRHAVSGNKVSVGLIAGLAHPALCRSLAAIHDAPEKGWSLERLAETAGMSRTSFATAFRETVGQTPGSYLARWRLTLANSQLSKGAPLKTVARSVGYASSAALSRAYARQFGHSPRIAKSRSGAAL